jgi:hypothetical protein
VSGDVEVDVGHGLTVPLRQKVAEAGQCSLELCDGQFHLLKAKREIGGSEKGPARGQDTRIIGHGMD